MKQFRCNLMRAFCLFCNETKLLDIFLLLGLASDFEMRQLYSTQELMPHELEKLKWPKGKNEEKRTASWNWWLPCAWATRLIRDAYDRGFVDNKENMALVYQVNCSPN